MPTPPKKPTIKPEPASTTAVAKPVQHGKLVVIDGHETEESYQKDYIEYLRNKHNVKVGSKFNILKSLGLNSSAYYNPFNRTINSQYNPSGFYKGMNEIPHAIQADSMGTLPFLGKILYEGLKYGHDAYSTPGTLENQAHGELNERLMNDYNRSANYAPLPFKRNGGKIMSGPKKPTIPPPTRQDSLDLYNNAIALRNFYSPQRGYSLMPKSEETLDQQLDWEGFGDYDSFKFMQGHKRANVGETAKRDIGYFTKGSFKSDGTQIFTADEELQLNYPNLTKTQVLQNIAKGVRNTGIPAGHPYRSQVQDNVHPFINWSAPMNMIDFRIRPQGYAQYSSEGDPGGATMIYQYDPLAVAPWDILNPAQQKARLAKYGFSGTPYDRQPKSVPPSASNNKIASTFKPMAKNPNYISMLQRRPGLVPQAPIDSTAIRGPQVAPPPVNFPYTFMGPAGVWQTEQQVPQHLQGGSNWTNPSYEPTNRTNNMWRRQGGPIMGRVVGQPTQRTADYREYQGEQIPQFDLEGFDVRPFNNLAAPSSGRADNSVMNDPVAMGLMGAIGAMAKGFRYAPNLARSIASEMTMGASDVVPSRFPKFKSSEASKELYNTVKRNEDIDVGGFNAFDDNYRGADRPQIWNRVQEHMFPFNAPYKGRSPQGARFEFVPQDYIRDVRAMGAKAPRLVEADDFTSKHLPVTSQLSQGYNYFKPQRDWATDQRKAALRQLNSESPQGFNIHDVSPGSFGWTRDPNVKQNLMRRESIINERYRPTFQEQYVNRHGGYLPQHKFGDFLGRNAGMIGGIVGGVAGTIIAPGVGTTMGAALGSQLGGIAQNEYMENQQEDLAQRSAISAPVMAANAQQFMARDGGVIHDRHAWAGAFRRYEDGGLIEYEGPSHEAGGIPVTADGMPVARPYASAEVEGGETSLDGYVFSDTLKDKASGKTFADLSKAIERRYKGRTDKVAQESRDREMSRLMASNEELRLKKENAMIKRKMGGFLKTYEPGGFLGLTGNDWAQFGIGNVGNIMAMAQASKPYQRTVAPRNEYAQTIASGPTRLDPTQALFSNNQTYTSAQRDVPGMVNGSGQGYLAGRMAASGQKYAADANIHTQFGNANAGLQEQYKNRLMQLGATQQQYDWNKQLADQQARYAKWNMMNQAAGSMGVNFDSMMNRAAWNKLMGQYKPTQYHMNPDGSYGSYRGSSTPGTVANTEGVMPGEPAYSDPSIQPYNPWKIPGIVPGDTSKFAMQDFIPNAPFKPWKLPQSRMGGKIKKGGKRYAC